MSAVRGHDEATKRRVEAAVRKLERFHGPLSRPTGHQNPLRIRRAVLDGDLRLEQPITGREQIQGGDGHWLTTDITIAEIYKDTPTLGYLGEGDEVWLLPQSGKWYAIAAAHVDYTGFPTSGCCEAKCVKKSHLLIGGKYAERYRMSPIPQVFGGSVEMEYIGTNADDFHYWESDSFDWFCAGGHDQYLWRMIAGVDATGPCNASWGQSNVVVYLVNVGSGTDCPDLAALSPGGQPRWNYISIEDWRSRCSTRFYLTFPQRMHEELQRVLHCSVCVTAVERETVDPGCNVVSHPSPWPDLLNAEIVESTVAGVEPGHIFTLIWKPSIGSHDGPGWSLYAVPPDSPLDIYDIVFSPCGLSGTGGRIAFISSSYCIRGDGVSPGSNGCLGRYLPALDDPLDFTLLTGVWTPVGIPGLYGTVTWRVYE